MTTRLLVLLVLLTVLPAMGMLWLMNRAVAMETAAGQQQVLEAYRGQLRLVRSRLDPLWRAHAAHLEEGDAITPELTAMKRSMWRCIRRLSRRPVVSRVPFSGPYVDAAQRRHLA